MQREGAGSESIIVEHLSKFDSLMPSLALIFHLVERANWEFQRSVSQLPAGASHADLSREREARQHVVRVSREPRAAHLRIGARSCQGKPRNEFSNKIQEGRCTTTSTSATSIVAGGRFSTRRNWCTQRSRRTARNRLAEREQSGEDSTTGQTIVAHVSHSPEG